MRVIVPKKTGTYSEALEAAGTASLLEELGFRQVTLRDLGGAFEIQSRNDIPPDSWEVPSPGYPYIWERRKEPERPNLPNVLDYEEQREIRDRWLAYQNAVKKKAARASLAAQDLTEPDPPSANFPQAAIVSRMRSGWDADRDLAHWIGGHPDDTLTWVRSVLARDTTFSSPPRVTSSQVLNPIAGRGVNSPKTKARSSKSPPPKLSDSFSEWMKLRGLWKVALLYRVGEDFRFFCLEPADITIGGLSLVRDDLNQLQLWRAVGVRLDIEAALRCTELLLKRSDLIQPDTSPISVRLRGLTPRAVIAGLRQCLFKGLGRAAALMNDAFLPLPAWFVVETPADANNYFEIISETIGDSQSSGCLDSLEEKNSDDGAILQQYRQWLLTADLTDFLAFHSRFAVHLMSRLAADDWARPFSTPNLDKLFSKAFPLEGPMLNEIISNEGFLRVARAVRNCTIYPVMSKHANRDVHFGLAQKWKQKIKAGNREFAAALADFVQVQNWEVADKLEGKGLIVTTEDLNAVIRLIDSHGAELVGSLLLAYGYARAPKVDSGVLEGMPQPEPETANSAE